MQEQQHKHERTPPVLEQVLVLFLLANLIMYGFIPEYRQMINPQVDIANAKIAENVKSALGADFPEIEKTEFGIDDRYMEIKPYPIDKSDEGKFAIIKEQFVLNSEKKPVGQLEKVVLIVNIKYVQGKIVYFEASDVTFNLDGSHSVDPSTRFYSNLQIGEIWE